MAAAEVTVSNCASGELSSKMRGRYDLPAFQHGLERNDNFINELQGPDRYRNGFRHVGHTRLNQIACLLKFQFSNTQSYGLEFTNGHLRFYKDNGIVTENPVTITGITKSGRATVTAAAHGYANGDEVYIAGVKGMYAINGKFFIVKNVATNTFDLTDQDGNDFSTLSYAAYSSAGQVSRIYEIVSPYAESDDLFAIRFAQNADTMYLVHPNFEPRKLTRSGATSWAINLYDRTADPFLAKKTISAVTQANPASVTCTGHGYSTGQKIVIGGIVGMTQLNGRWFTITKVDADTFTLDGVNSTGYTGYSSAGYASRLELLPGAVTFHQGRTAYTKIPNAPLKFILSRSPDNAGVTRYDDFTSGTDADDAIFDTINAEDESQAQWIRSNIQFLLIGGFTGIYKITGGTDSAAITPTSAQALRISAIGVSELNPVTYDTSTIYSEANGLIVRSLDYNLLWQNFTSKDKNLISDEITRTGIKQFAFTAGRPDIVWSVTNDGRLIGMTFKIDEDVFGWHRHTTRAGDKYISAVALSRSNNYHRLWAVIERQINGATRRFVSYLEDPAIIPEEIDFYTGKENQKADFKVFLRAEYEALKSAFHVDSGLSYDGSDLTVASTTITPSLMTGLNIIFTAGASIFSASDVGREIRLKPVNGIGTGRAKITSVTNSTTVVCDIMEDFSGAMTTGNWFFTIGTILNLDHLEGCTVKIITDGAEHPDQVVKNGQITLDYQASMVHAGLQMVGILKTMNLEVGGVDGPSQTKPKNIVGIGVKFFQTAGATVGTSLYRQTTIKPRKGSDYMDRPPQLTSTSIRVNFTDSWEREKHLYVVQEKALPCIVQLLMPYAHTDNG